MADSEQNIVLCFPAEPRHLEQIRRAAPNATVIDAGQTHVAEALLTADIYFGHAKVPVDWTRVLAHRRLRWIQSSAAGLDHCLVPAVIESDIPVTSASGLFANQVAEQTLALLFGVIRRAPTFFRAQSKREFIRRPTDDLHGKTIGIVGLGGNGLRIAQLLAPLGNRIIATDYWPRVRPSFIQDLWLADRLHDLLASSDVVILCVPLNAHTEGMIGAAEFAKMKPGSYLINVARGPVVQEIHLCNALASGHLQGAGLDVTEVEPLANDSPLWSLDNVLITPHVGAQSHRRVDDTVDFFCQNLKRLQEGLPLRNLVDKQLGFPGPEV